MAQRGNNLTNKEENQKSIFIYTNYSTDMLDLGNIHFIRTPFFATKRALESISLQYAHTIIRPRS